MQVRAIVKQHLSQWTAFRKSGVSFVVKLLRYAILICVSFIIIYPLIYLISMSIRAGGELLDPSVIWIPKNPTMETIKTAWDAMNYPSALLNSAFFVITGTVLEIVVCSITAYGFARFKFPLKKAIFALLVFSIIVPNQMSLIPLFSQLRYFDFFGIGRLIGLFTGTPLTINIYNTPWSFIIPSVLGNGVRGAFFIYIFRQFFMGLPKDLEDAAYIDGCGYFKTFLKIMAPTAIPPYLVTFILSLIWHWNDTLWTGMFYPDLVTLPVALEGLAVKGAEFFDLFVYKRAGALLMILPILLVFLFLQKFFMESVDRTGLK